MMKLFERIGDTAQAIAITCKVSIGRVDPVQMVKDHTVSIKAQTPRGPFTLWPRTADGALAIFAILLTVVISLTDEGQPFYNHSVSDVPVAALLVYVLTGGVLYWRRSHPLEVLGAIIVLSILSNIFAYTNGCLFPTVISLYSVGRYVEINRWSYIAAGITITLVSLSSITSNYEIDKDIISVELIFAILVPLLLWYIGRRIRFRGNYIKLLQERAEQLEREQDREARRAVAEERARIAREMHDVVAHQVSLMTVQAGAAKTVAIDDPQGALQAMDAVENAGRQALHELRHLIGILRPESQDGGLDPQPGIADVPRLIEHLARAGVDVSFQTVEFSKKLPTRVDLSVFRIIQEALTNILKHAGPNIKAEVHVSMEEKFVVTHVRNDGGGATILPGSGHGIAGMRERAQLLGGMLEAGPQPGGGFSVVARIPTGDDTL